jgi:hypothetical protein
VPAGFHRRDEQLQLKIQADGRLKAEAQKIGTPTSGDPPTCIALLGFPLSAIMSLSLQQLCWCNVVKENTVKHKAWQKKAHAKQAGRTPQAVPFRLLFNWCRR